MSLLQKSAGHFVSRTIIENINIQIETKITPLDKELKGTLVNRTCNSSKIGSFEIMSSDIKNIVTKTFIQNKNLNNNLKSFVDLLV